MRRIFGLLCVIAVPALLVGVFYMTCITEIQKTWLDMDAGESYNQTTEPLYEGTSYCQHFIAQRSIVTEMLIRVVTWGREYAAEDRLTIEVAEDAAGTVVAHCSVPLSAFEDNQLHALPFSGLRLDKGEWYSLRVTGHAAEEARSVSIMLSDRGNPDWEFCVRDGDDARMEQDLSIIIRGRGMI